MIRHYCTYFDKNYASKGITMLKSLIAHETGDYRVFVICLDEITRVLIEKLNLKNVIAIPLHYIEERNQPLIEARSNRSVVEYYWTLTPVILKYLFENYQEIEVLTYLDSDLYFFSSPDPIFDELGSKSVLIHEHRYSNDLIHLEINGRFNVGLLIFKRDKNSIGLLETWRRQCLDWCYARIEGEKFGDQGYLSNWDKDYSFVHILRHLGGGVAPWNQIQYDIKKDRKNKITINNEKLVFYHFHSLEIVNNNIISASKHATYIIDEVVLRLCYYPYSKALLDTISSLRNIFPEFNSGITFSSALSKELCYIINDANKAFKSQYEMMSRLEGTWVYYSPRPRDIRKTLSEKKEGKQDIPLWKKDLNQSKKTDDFSSTPELLNQKYEEALVNIKNEEFNKALDNLVAVLNLWPEGKIKSSGLQLQALLNLTGNVSLSINNLDFAKRFFEMELRLKSDSSAACTGLADAYYAEENYEAARTYYERAVKNDSKNKRASEQLSNLIRLLDKSPSANSNVAKQNNINPGDKAPGHTFSSGLEIKVSAVVSVYNSQKFMRGCLDDLINQTLYNNGQLEIVVVNSGSKEDEESIIEEYRKKYPNIKYLKTPERETVYQAWNRGIKAAAGKYITNANTDDRHRYDALEVMADHLDRDNEIALVYGDLFVTNLPNQTFENHIRSGYIIRPEYSKDIMLTGCHMGPQPMWRRELHNQIGYFEEDLRSAADYEFWCRIASSYNMKHVNEILGLYYNNPDGVENSNQMLSSKEALAVIRSYSKKLPVSGRNYINNHYSETLSSYEKYVNIGMVTYNRLEFTKRAIDAVIKYTDYPYVLTAVDNNSSDGTKEYLKELKRTGVIKNLILLEENLGVAKASNIAWLTESFAEYYLKLDNDIVIQKYGWLTDMVRVSDNILQAGAVAYNFEPVSYPLSTVNGIKIRPKEQGNLGGACILIPKRTMKILGYWSEEYGLYGEEDADYGFRIRLIKGLNAYMEDENIGLHLPNGKAAVIDPVTLAAADELEESMHADYRKWKDRQRFENVKGGKLSGNSMAYYNGTKPIYTVPAFAKEYLAKMKMQSSTSEESPIVSVIIPVFNKLEFTKGCIEAIYRNTDNCSFEIIVVDNGSTDDTRTYLEEAARKYNNIMPLFMDENLGFAKANNLASRKARGKFLLFLNNDTEPKPGWMKAMLEVFDQEEKPGAVGSKLLFPDGSIQHAGVITVKDEQMNLPLSPWHYRYQHPDDENVNKLKKYDAVTAACVMIPKKLFFDVGCFGEEYWNGYEDVDLCYKILLAGYNIYYQPKSVVVHFESKSGKQRFIKEKENLEILIRKWEGKITPTYIHFKDGETVRYNFASVVILTYNSSGTILNCLNSVAANLREHDEVIVVDNASRDNTAQMVKKFIKNRKQFRFIENKENLGFSAGTNVGIRASVNPFIVLLNPDTVVTRNWLENLTVHFDSFDIAAVGPLSNYVAGRQRMDLYAKEKFTLKEKPDYIAAKYYQWYKGLSVETKLLIGFCMAIRRDVINRLGMLDEELFLGNDDLDLSWRFRLAGMKLRVAADTYIYHEGQHSFNTEGKSKTSVLVQQSTDALYAKLQKHYGEANVPTPMELWEMNWFKPSNAVFNTDARLMDEKQSEILHEAINKEIIREEETGKENRTVEEITTSIILLTYNALKYTKECIDSIGRYTRGSYELIVIDNASNSDTLAYLEELAQKNSRVVFIANKENAGFPKGINQGIRAARGKYILIANNDIVVTEGWLDRMIEAAESNPEIAIAGPLSNEVSGFQRDREAKYKTIPEMHKYAAKLRKKNKGELFFFPRVAFLCTLIKKEVIEKIGGLDERFTPGNFEDDDFCLRAQLAGYKTVILKDVFIHHYGSKSFKADGIDKYAERLSINREKFVSKWGADPDEIWIKGKEIKSHSLEFPLDNDPIKEKFSRAQILIGDNEYELALNEIKDAMLYQDNNTGQVISNEELLNIAGNLSLALGDVEEARGYFEQELRSNPSSSSACAGLADIFMLNEEYESAKTMYEWAVKNDKSNLNASEKLKEINLKLNLPDDHNSLAEEEKQLDAESLVQLFTESYDLFKAGEYDAALKTIMRAEINPAEEFPVGSDDIFVLRGSILMQLGDAESAKVAFEQALQANPNSSEACHGLGEIFYQAGMLKEAKIMLEWAVKNSSSNKYACDSLANVNRELGLNESDNTLLPAEEKEKLYGNIRQPESGLDEAETNIAEISEAEFSDFDLALKDAYELFEDGAHKEALLRLYEAEELIDKSENKLFTHEDLLILKGSLQLLLKRDDSARISFEKALKLNPSSSEACYGLGRIFYQADMMQQAKVMLEWAVKNNPENINACSLLREVNIQLEVPEDDNTLMDDNSKDTDPLDELLTEAYDLYSQKQYQPALAKLLLMEDMLEETGNEERKNEMKPIVHNFKGFNYLALRKLEKSRDSFSKALELNPSSSQACAGLGEIFYLGEMDQEAKTMFEWAVKNDPQNQFALNGLEKVNLQLGLPAGHSTLEI